MEREVRPWGRNGSSRYMRRLLYLFWVSLVLVFGSGISSGVHAQETPTSLSAKLLNWSKKLEQAEKLSNDQTRLLRSYEALIGEQQRLLKEQGNEIERLLTLSDEQTNEINNLLSLSQRQAEGLERLSSDNQTLRGLLDQYDEGLSSLHGYYRSKIATLEAELLRSRILGVAGTIGGGVVGYTGRGVYESSR